MFSAQFFGTPPHVFWCEMGPKGRGGSTQSRARSESRKPNIGHFLFAKEDLFLTYQTSGHLIMHVVPAAKVTGIISLIRGERLDDKSVSSNP